MGEGNIFRASCYGAIDGIRQTIKDRFVQEDLKQLININKCLIDATNKETVQDIEEKLAYILTSPNKTN